MKKSQTVLLTALLLFMTFFICIGYANLSDVLKVLGVINVEGADYDVYISSISPETSAGVSVSGTSGTVMSSKVTDRGTATFSITVVNKSDKTYVFERIIDGAEVNIEGVYNGNDILYSLEGLVPLQEIQPNMGTIVFTLKIVVPSGVTADNYILNFNFIEKQGSEILPDDSDPETPPEESTTTPDSEPDVPPESSTPSTTPKPDPDPEPDEMHGDFRGLIEALLSDQDNCLNDTDLIYNAVMESLRSNKRPEEDAPILHCLVNSISGGTMTEVATSANSKLTSNLHFIFEADPNNLNRLFIYMYYEDDCTEDKIGSEILVYKQVVTRNSDDRWVEDGTYIGRATVGYYFGGGKNGKDVLTVNPYSWKAGAPENQQ